MVRASDCDNPYTKVWDAMWTMAEANSSLTDLIRTNNRIKFDTDLGEKQAITEGDLPELALLAGGAVIELESNSTSCRIVRNFDWCMSTGEYDINKYYFCVSWELLRAMFDWKTTLCSLEWPNGSGWNFVTNMQLADLDEGTYMVDKNRQILGWAGMMRVQVEMHLRISDMEVS